MITRASDSSVWAGSYLDSRLELWNSSGNLERSFTVDLPWLIRSKNAPDGPIYRVRPQPVLQSLYCCQGHLLLAIYQRPRRDWQASPDTSSRERPVLQATEYLKYIEQVVVIIDPRSGVVEGELSGESVALGGFLADGRIFGFVADPDDRQLLVLLAVRRTE